MIPLSIYYRARCGAYVLCTHTRPFRSKAKKQAKTIHRGEDKAYELESKWNIFYLYTLAECENIEKAATIWLLYRFHIVALWLRILQFVLHSHTLFFFVDVELILFIY